MECFSTLHRYRNSSLLSTHTKDFSYTDEDGKIKHVSKGDLKQVIGSGADKALSQYFANNPDLFRVARSGVVSEGYRNAVGDTRVKSEDLRGSFSRKEESPNESNHGSGPIKQHGSNQKTNYDTLENSHNKTPSDSNLDSDSITHNKEKPDRKENGEELPNFINEDITLEEPLTYSRED